jgi:hypothetical protein
MTMVKLNPLSEVPDCESLDDDALHTEQVTEEQHISKGKRSIRVFLST